MQNLRTISATSLILGAGLLLAACNDNNSNCGNCGATVGYAGTLSGLPTGTSVLLQDNTGTNATLSANGNFSFSTYAPWGFPALVGVLVQPTGDDCAVSNSGGGGVAGVTITCAPLAGTVNSLLTDFAGMVSQGSAEGSGLAASFNNPNGIATDASGTVYVADTGNNTIRQITSAGVVSTLAGTAGSTGSADATGSVASFRSPNAVATDGVGNVYVADTINGTIRKIVASTGAVTTIAGTAGVLGSTDSTTATAASFRYPNGVAADASGNVYVADTGNHTIRLITSAGAVSTIAGTAGSYGSADGTGAAARFNAPVAVALDGAGNLFVADYNNSTIRKIVLSSGAVTTLAGMAGSYGATDGTGMAATFNGPQGIAIDGSGNLYIADTFSYAVRKVSPAGVVTTVVGSSTLPVFDAGILPGALEQVFGVALSGTTLYITTNGGIARVTNVP